jgi:medium-chain acyl-[acyl-carrier-protein] hydrolase
VSDRFFSGIPHPHLLGDLAPDIFYLRALESNFMGAEILKPEPTPGAQESKPPQDLQTSSPVLVWTERFRVHSFEADLNGAGTLEGVCRHFQEAAWNHAEHLGLGYEQLRRENKIWVLSRLLLKLDRSLRWGETITVHTWPRQVRSAFALRDFEMVDSAGMRLAAGSSAWLVLDVSSRKPQRVDKMISSISTFPAKRALDQDPASLDAVQSDRSITRFTARYSDIDVNGHVNNARYVGWLMDSYSLDFHRAHEVKRLEINYLGETAGAETVSVFTSQMKPGDYQHSLVKTDIAIEVCRARILWAPRDTSTACKP